LTKGRQLSIMNIFCVGRFFAWWKAENRHALADKNVMEINISQIDESDGLDIDYLYPEGEPDLEDESSQAVGQTAVKLHAGREGEEVLLRGKIAASVQLSCDRCLLSFAIPVTQSFDLLYLQLNRNRGAQEEHELSEDDLSISYFQGQFINLDDLVREQLQLALPMARLCREDCRGLCQQCGASLNEAECACSFEQVDPRWAALKGLKNN
jgi:uncharacterized protein